MRGRAPGSGGSGTADPGIDARRATALGTVYVVWGSTYLAIRFAVESLPPFSMAGTRFLVSGALLYLWARLRGKAPPSRRHWGPAFLIGALLLLCGNGAVVWAEQQVASGLAAVLVATEPLWVALLLAAWPGGERPTLATLLGLLIGFGGAVLLVAPAELTGAQPVALDGALVILLGSLAWAAGSLYSRGAELPASAAISTAIQMLAGGLLLVMAGGLAGEWTSLDPESFTRRSVAAWAYLVVFGSLVAFSAYAWLVRTTRPTLVSTYAYVNPVIAVFLGWLLAGESLSWRSLAATLLVVGSVFLVSRGRRLR